MSVVLLVVFLLCALPAHAFYEAASDTAGISLRGFTDLAASITKNPTGNSLYDERIAELWSGDFRLLADGRQGESLRYEANVLQTVQSAANTVVSATRASQQTVERSGNLSWLQHESPNSQARLSLDTFNVRYGNQDQELIIGRQPVSLATTFYFSPNDFFAPFAAQTFYRVYKPGVDGLRYEKRLGNLSQLTILGVLGYRADAGTGNGWSMSPDWSRGSLLLRYSFVYEDFEWSFLGGSVRNERITGGAVSGELFDWLGLRAEMHYAAPETSGGSSSIEASLGLEHRFASSLNIQFEQFYHGKGAATSEAAEAAIVAGETAGGYLGRDYTALGASYEFTPLFTGQCTFLKNWSDHSQLFTAQGIYSTSDESELAVTISMPMGAGPHAGTVNSEFGSLPAGVGVEFRLYF